MACRATFRPPRPAPTFRIRVCTVGGREIDLELDQAATIADAKHQLEHLCGIPACQQRLLMGCVVLEGSARAAGVHAQLSGSEAGGSLQLVAVPEEFAPSGLEPEWESESEVCESEDEFWVQNMQAEQRWEEAMCGRSSFAPWTRQPPTRTPRAGRGGLAATAAWRPGHTSPRRPGGSTGTARPSRCCQLDLMLSATLFADDPRVTEGRAEQPLAGSSSRETPASVELVACAQPAAEPRMGTLLNRNPFGRDGPCRQNPPIEEWSVDPLVEYLRGVVQQIEHNIQNHCVPTYEILDALVSRLMADTQRHVKRAPETQRQVLQVLLERRDFERRASRCRCVQQVTTLEELKTRLNYVIEDLLRDISCGCSPCPSS